MLARAGTQRRRRSRQRRRKRPQPQSEAGRAGEFRYTSPQPASTHACRGTRQHAVNRRPVLAPHGQGYPDSCVIGPRLFAPHGRKRRVDRKERREKSIRTHNFPTEGPVEACSARGASAGLGSSVWPGQQRKGWILSPDLHRIAHEAPVSAAARDQQQNCPSVAARHALGH